MEGRTNVECRSKYMNMQPNINKGAWTHLEDVVVAFGQAIYGSKFSDIASLFARESIKNQCSKEQTDHETQPNLTAITHLRTEV